MLTPESMLMMHTMRHAELLAELSTRSRRASRATRRARASALERARDAVAAARRATEPHPVCCVA